MGESGRLLAASKILTIKPGEMSTEITSVTSGPVEPKSILKLTTDFHIPKLQNGDSPLSGGKSSGSLNSAITSPTNDPGTADTTLDPKQVTTILESGRNVRIVDPRNDFGQATSSDEELRRRELDYLV